MFAMFRKVSSQIASEGERINYVPDIWCWHIGEAMVGDGGQISFI